MGKKFVTVSSNSKKYKIYTSDLKGLIQRPIRKVPAVPSFH